LVSLEAGKHVDEPVQYSAYGVFLQMGNLARQGSVAGSGVLLGKYRTEIRTKFGLAHACLFLLLLPPPSKKGVVS
jgi:hypothetical protein